MNFNDIGKVTLTNCYPNCMVEFSVRITDCGKWGWVVQSDIIYLGQFYWRSFFKLTKWFSKHYELKARLKNHLMATDGLYGTLVWFGPIKLFFIIVSPFHVSFLSLSLFPIPGRDFTSICEATSLFCFQIFENVDILFAPHSWAWNSGNDGNSGFVKLLCIICPVIKPTWGFLIVAFISFLNKSKALNTHEGYLWVEFKHLDYNFVSLLYLILYFPIALHFNLQ